MAAASTILTLSGLPDLVSSPNLRGPIQLASVYEGQAESFGSARRPMGIWLSEAFT